MSLSHVLRQLRQPFRLVERVDLVGHDDARLGGQPGGGFVAAAFEELQLARDDVEVVDRVATRGGRHVDDVRQHFRALEVREELRAEADARMRAFDEAGHVGDDEAAVAAQVHDGGDQLRLWCSGHANRQDPTYWRNDGFHFHLRLGWYRKRHPSHERGEHDSCGLVPRLRFYLRPDSLSMREIPPPYSLQYLARLPALSNPIGRIDRGFYDNWSVYYWAWWISWAPFVGTFMARISRGRTVREFLLGAMLAPSVLCIIWLSVFGNTAIDQVVNGNNKAIAGAAIESQLFLLLDALPYTAISSFVGIVLIMIFFVTGWDRARL